MSNLGLNSNIYYVTGEYINFLNDFIINLENYPDVERKNKLDEVKNFIEKLSDANSTDPQIQILSVIIEKELRKNKLKPNKFYKAIIDNIKSKSFHTIIDKLDYVITTLDNEHFKALAKIKEE